MGSREVFSLRTLGSSSKEWLHKFVSLKSTLLTYIDSCLSKYGIKMRQDKHQIDGNNEF